MAPRPPIHVISLARTPDRLARFRTDNPDLEGWRLYPAVDGTTVDAATREALGDTSLWSPGGVGVALSQQALWRHCVESQAPLTICEDDAVLRGDFRDAAAEMLSDVPDFDLVLWGWNFDAVAEVEVTPGVAVAMLADQARLRQEVASFRQSKSASVLLRLRKALGTPCYTLSPKGAAALLARALPARPVQVTLPLMPREIGNLTPDVMLCSLYGDLSAYLAFPPLAVTRNEWTRSTVRLPGASSPSSALAQADVLEARGAGKEALAVIQSATVAAPETPALWSRLGRLLAEQGLLTAAATALEKALGLEARRDTAAYNLARVYLLQSRSQEALDLLDEVVASMPKFALGHSNRGVALLALGRALEAQASFRAATDLEPDLMEAQRGLAAADQALLASHRRLEALVAATDSSERAGRFQEAWETARQAVALEPSSPHALNNLGVACLRLGQAAEAEDAFRAAIASLPDFAAAHHGLAFALLKQGRWREAWPEYEWRLRLPTVEAWTRGFGAPPWSGEAAPDATLLLAAEQGLGDTLQAACLIPEIRARVGSVVLQAPPPLARLLRRLPGVDEVVEDAAVRPRHDLWLPLMSLPGLLGVGPDRRAPVTPPLAPDPEVAAAWARRLPKTGLRIGVAWQGNPDARVEYGRSFPLAALEALAAVPGVTLISLQKGFGAEQMIERPPGLESVIDLGADFQRGDFEETAGIVAHLDLIVCCDTALAHLAGALGRPVWIAVGHNADWRWPAHRRDTPWYASARVFRGEADEPWPMLFGRMAILLPMWQTLDPWRLLQGG